MDPVYCIGCERVDKHSRKSASWYWLCTAFKQIPHGAIAPRVLDSDPPYPRCVDVNRFNNCNHFEQLKEPADVHAPAD